MKYKMVSWNIQTNTFITIKLLWTSSWTTRIQLISNGLAGARFSPRCLQRIIIMTLRDAEEQEEEEEEEEGKPKAEGEESRPGEGHRGHASFHPRLHCWVVMEPTCMYN